MRSSHQRQSTQFTKLPLGGCSLNAGFDADGYCAFRYSCEHDSHNNWSHCWRWRLAALDCGALGVTVESYLLGC